MLLVVSSNKQTISTLKALNKCNCYQAAAFRGCQNSQSCVQIALCGQYLHYVNEPPKNWPSSVRREALMRLCDTQQSVNGLEVYVVWLFNDTTLVTHCECHLFSDLLHML